MAPDRLATLDPSEAVGPPSTDNSREAVVSATRPAGQRPTSKSGFVVPVIPALRGSEIAGLRDHQAWAWLYGVNVYLAIRGGWVLSYIEHFWSLAVEEHFYLVWPLVVWLLAAKRRAFLIVSLAIAAISFGGRVVASLSGVSPVVTTVLTPFQL